MSSRSTYRPSLCVCVRRFTCLGTLGAAEFASVYIGKNFLITLHHFPSKTIRCPAKQAHCSDLNSDTLVKLSKINVLMLCSKCGRLYFRRCKSSGTHPDHLFLKCHSVSLFDDVCVDYHQISLYF